MTLVVDTFKTLLPAKLKTSPNGWTSFNAPCCSNRGHRADTRKRGGIRFDNNGIIYNCFNCRFTAHWEPGSQFTNKLKTLAKYFNAPDETINKLVLESLKTSSSTLQHVEQPTEFVFPKKSLPPDSDTLLNWVNKIDTLTPDLQLKFTNIIGYLMDRGFSDPISANFYWSTNSTYVNRVIVPYTWNNVIVGNTARLVTPGKLKYLNDQPENYLFNVDAQHADQKYVLVTEGPFDALSVGGVAILKNNVSVNQAQILNNLHSEIIIIPDQDSAGLEVFDQAIQHNWSVATPNWEDDIKDPADAVNRYGKLFVVVDAILSAQKGAIKISLAKKQLEQKLKRLEKNNL